MTTDNDTAPDTNDGCDTGFPSHVDVTFAVDLTTADGVDREAGSTGEVPAAEARLLIRMGRARRADEDEPAPKKAAARKPAKKTAARKKPADKKAPAKADTPTTPTDDDPASDGAGSGSGN